MSQLKRWTKTKKHIKLEDDRPSKKHNTKTHWVIFCPKMTHILLVLLCSVFSPANVFLLRVLFHIKVLLSESTVGRNWAKKRL